MEKRIDVVATVERTRKEKHFFDLPEFIDDFMFYSDGSVWQEETVEAVNRAVDFLLNENDDGMVVVIHRRGIEIMMKTVWMNPDGSDYN